MADKNNYLFSTNKRSMLKSLKTCIDGASLQGWFTDWFIYYTTPTSPRPTGAPKARLSLCVSDILARHLLAILFWNMHH